MNPSFSLPLSIPLLDAPKPGANTYGRKLRRCVVPMGVIETLLSLDGTRSYKMDGWPTGAKIVGADIMASPFAAIVYLYHPDFAYVPPDELPPLVKVTARVSN